MPLSELLAGAGSVLGQGAAVAGLMSGRRRLSTDFEDHADGVRRSGVDGVLELLRAPPQLGEGASRPEQVLLNAMREPVEESVLGPGAVVVHVYHLNEGLSGANTALSFASDIMTLGGAFHAAVEVYGGEWTFGSYGVECLPPRSDEAHVYKCSIYMGRTELDREQLAPVLFELVRDWQGASYDLLSRNCCCFAAELCARLRVGELPAWVDRFARLLHGGREAGKATWSAVRRARSVTSKLVHEVALSPWDAEESEVVEGPRRKIARGAVGGA